MSTIPTDRQPGIGFALVHALAKNWWLLLLRGIAAIIFGLLAFAWPGLTLLTLILFYGAFALVDGVLAVIAAITGGAPGSRWWLAIVGLLGIAAGLVTFLTPGLTALVLLFFIAAWAIASERPRRASCSSSTRSASGRGSRRWPTGSRRGATSCSPRTSSTATARGRAGAPRRTCASPALARPSCPARWTRHGAHPRPARPATAGVPGSRRCPEHAGRGRRRHRLLHGRPARRPRGRAVPGTSPRWAACTAAAWSPTHPTARTWRWPRRGPRSPSGTPTTTGRCRPRPSRPSAPRWTDAGLTALNEVFAGRAHGYSMADTSIVRRGRHRAALRGPARAPGLHPRGTLTRGGAPGRAPRCAPWAASSRAGWRPRRWRRTPGPGARRCRRRPAARCAGRRAPCPSPRRSA